MPDCCLGRTDWGDTRYGVYFPGSRRMGIAKIAVIAKIAIIEDAGALTRRNQHPEIRHSALEQQSNPENFPGRNSSLAECVTTSE